MTEKERPRCPECNGKRVAITYNTETIEIRCQTGIGMYPYDCKSIGCYGFLIDKKTKKIIGKVDW